MLILLFFKFKKLFSYIYFIFFSTWNPRSLAYLLSQWIIDKTSKYVMERIFNLVHSIFFLFLLFVSLRIAARERERRKCLDYRERALLNIQWSLSLLLPSVKLNLSIFLIEHFASQSGHTNTHRQSHRYIHTHAHPLKTRVASHTLQRHTKSQKNK